MGALRTRAAGVAAAALAAVLVAGCTTSVEEIPLPGGADLGDHPYTVKVQFPDAINLVPQASVRVNDVPVGRVRKIALPTNAWNAEITLQVNGKVRLPANAIANLEQSSLLGEKYILLAAPKTAPSATPLKDGDTIPVARTSRNADTEEVFGALSMLLSGGGLPQIRTITREFNKTLGGRETEIRSTLRNLEKLMSTLNSNRTTITNVLDGLNRLSSTVSARQGQLTTALDDLSPGLKVVEEQRGQLVTLLRQLENLSKVATRTIKASKEDFVADLKAISVVLRKLADAGDTLPKSLEVLFTFPFPDEALKAIKGDYLNGFLSVTAAPGNDCVIPPVQETDDRGNPIEQQARAQALAATQPPPAGPQPTPCAPPGQTTQQAPQGGQPAQPGQQGQGGAGVTGGQEGPALPLPSVEGEGG